MRGDREGEPNVHPRRIPLDRRVEKGIDFGERDDFGKDALDLAARHPEKRPIEVNVLAPR